MTLIKFQRLRFNIIAGMISSGERLRPWRWAVSTYLLLGLLTRIALLCYGDTAIDLGVGRILAVFAFGAISDLIVAGFLFLPLVLFLAVFPVSWRRHRLGRAWLLGGMAAWVFLILFIGMAEWVFWGEFGTRFNFIAVDYLVYTHEVITNIWQSYPVMPVLTLMAFISLGICWWQRHRIIAPGDRHDVRPTKWRAFAVLLAIPFFAWWQMPDALPRLFENRYANDLASNGVYGFFHAFNAAELEYPEFYTTISRTEAYARVRELLAARNAPFASGDAHDLSRHTTNHFPPHNLNVVLISVESLSAKFLTRFGESRGITPNLDRMAREGLLFTNHYATGTRTVRGLEALSLSVPPTPGESIVKRPHNTGLVTLGEVFSEHGYDVKFLYGGYALFDNMRAYFSGNGYQVIDRGDIPSDRIHHENAWGVADEDIYTQALMEMDRSHGAGRHAFLHVMTTTNHRPYTFPDGRIDLPSGSSGRAGAVKYTDWAIGDFLARAGKKPWFAETLFVIVADHCASSAGKSTLPLANYHVPLLFYSPGNIAAREDGQLASQIDVAPTLLGMLHMDYSARFFGRDLLQPQRHSPYAFISTYQELGFVRDGELVELDPLVGPQVAIPAHTGHLHFIPGPYDEATRDAISLYEVAAEAFDSGALQRKKHG